VRTLRAHGAKVIDLVDRYTTGGPWGDDPDGSPCFIDPIGRIYLNELLATRKDMYQLMVDFEIIKNEMIIAQMDYNTLRDGKIHTQATIIFDLTDIGLRHIYGAGVGFFKEVIELGDNYYPERVKTMLACHAPTFVWALHKVISAFMDEETKARCPRVGSARARAHTRADAATNGSRIKSSSTMVSSA